MKRYKIYIDLTTPSLTENNNGENIDLISSPLFRSEKKALNWLSNLCIDYKDIDIIMCVFDKFGVFIDTYLISQFKQSYMWEQKHKGESL